MKVEDPAEIATEQKYFDEAFEAREWLREYRTGPSEAGVNKGSVESLNEQRRHALREMGSPDDPVAFGRIDDRHGEVLYIGKEWIYDEDRNTLVMNWQRDAAAPYYEATYDDPKGLVRKREYESARNSIETIDEILFEALARDVASLTERRGPDDSLLRSLESHRTGEMQDIVQTIQAAQYRLVREDLDQLLVVQGGPGTGKTVIALHRVSWLLWNRDERLRANDVLVLGPNRTFVRYIRRVLPDLGDVDVVQMAVRELGPSVRVNLDESAEVARLKGSLPMVDLLQAGLRSRIGLPDDLPPSEQRELQPQLERLAQLPYATGRAQFRDVLRSRSGTLSGRARSQSELDSLVDRTWPQLTAASFLNELFGSERRLLAAAGDQFSAGDVRRLYRRSAERRSDERWSGDDIPLLDEAERLINGNEPRQYGHVVLDEAQDLSDMQLRMIRRRSAGGSMTVLGDIAQSTGPFARDSWDSVVSVLRTNLPSSVRELELGYRVPRQVFEFASQLLPVAAPDVNPPQVVRDGEAPPDLVEVDDDDLGDAAVTAASAYSGRGLLVGVICPESRTEQVERAFRRAGVNYRLAGDDGVQAGINLIDATTAKGLEFEGVVVVDPAGIIDEDPHGVRLLYVALTRTTNRLTVVHTGDPLPLGDRVAPAAGAPSGSTSDEPEDESHTTVTPRPSRPTNRLLGAIAAGVVEDLRELVQPDQLAALYAEIGEQLGIRRSDGEANPD